MNKTKFGCVLSNWRLCIRRWWFGFCLGSNSISCNGLSAGLQFILGAISYLRATTQTLHRQDRQRYYKKTYRLSLSQGCCSCSVQLCVCKRRDGCGRRICAGQKGKECAHALLECEFVNPDPAICEKVIESKWRDQERNLFFCGCALSDICHELLWGCHQNEWNAILFVPRVKASTMAHLPMILYLVHYLTYSNCDTAIKRAQRQDRQA